MTEFKLTFRKDEEHLRAHLKAQQKPGAYLKGLIEKDMANPQDLYERIFGDINTDYGTMKRFIQECGLSAVESRLNACSKVQREVLTKELKARHKELQKL